MLGGLVRIPTEKKNSARKINVVRGRGKRKSRVDSLERKKKFAVISYMHRIALKNVGSRYGANVVFKAQINYQKFVPWLLKTDSKDKFVVNKYTGNHRYKQVCCVFRRRCISHPIVLRILLYRENRSLRQ